MAGAPSRRIGLIGYGAIGQQVAAGVAAGRAGNATLVAVLVRRPRAEPRPFVTSLAELLAVQPDIVVEAAGPDALVSYALEVVRGGASLVCASGSGLVDPAFRARLAEACRGSGAHIYVPSGALAGLDALAAAAGAELYDVRLRVVGPRPDVPEERPVFDGDALEGAARFPDRVNVAAVTALLVGRSVHLELREAPEGTRRELELTARGAFGELSARLNPTPLPERLTHIVALSLLATLHRLGEPIVFGT